MNDLRILDDERLELERLARLAGYAAGLAQRAFELGLIAIAVEHEHKEGDDLMSVADVLRTQAAAVKQSSADVKAAIDSAIGRLSDNPTAADVQAAVDDLTSAQTSNKEALAAAGSIDPDTTTGGVVDDGSGGVVEAGGDTSGNADAGTGSADGGDVSGQPA